MFAAAAEAWSSDLLSLTEMGSIVGDFFGAQALSANAPVAPSASASAKRLPGREV
jgi:hypothetical protein